MTSLLKDVIVYGTGARALSLGRRDLAGKTGTTNENVDAWFCGYNSALAAVAWIGYDQPRSLGGSETGGVAALPMWIGYMQKALKGTPEMTLAAPSGIISVRINAESGLQDDSGSISEYFFAEFPPRGREDGLGTPGAAGAPARDIREQLF
jgi:penicillin-binding protein 1A